MATYKNDYVKKEDPMLWEIHEIRHKLNRKYRSLTLEQINSHAKNILKKQPSL